MPWELESRRCHWSVLFSAERWAWGSGWLKHGLAWVWEVIAVADNEEVVAIAEEHRSGDRDLQWEQKETTGVGKFLKGGNPLVSSSCPVTVS